jgi:hypothetical protein
VDLENNKMKENWGMNSFYVNLQTELADAKEELWVQTQIDGAEAGKKILLKGEPKDTDSVFVDEKGERITSEDVDNFVKDTFSAKVGSKTTNTTLVLLNDFEVHGQASCVKAENYNIEIGEKFAVEKAKDKIWEVLGFVLQWGINGIKKK